MISDAGAWTPCARVAEIGLVPLRSSTLLQAKVNSSPESKGRVTLNISGRRYEAYLSTLERFPKTLLGSAEREYFYDQQHGEYYFDRDPDVFRFILSFYRKGRLHYPKDECACAFEEELSFFRIKQCCISECCWEDFHDRKKECDERLEDSDADYEPSPCIEENHDPSKMGFRQKLWLCLENPQRALIAKIFYYVTGFFIAVSIFTTIIETVDCGRGKSCGNAYENIFFGIEAACVAVFTVEYSARLFSAPNRCKHARNPLSVIDVIAILPFYVGLFVSKSAISGAFVTLRVFRVFRVFKFSRHSKGLRILGFTLKSCASELGFLLFSLGMAVIIFSTVVYYVEKDVVGTKFTSIPNSFWYTIVTMTTLGYGDMVPNTIIGKLVGSICSLSGVLVIALPVPVIVSNFSRIYLQNQRQDQRKANKKQREFGSVNDLDQDMLPKTNISRSKVSWPPWHFPFNHSAASDAAVRSQPGDEDSVSTAKITLPGGDLANSANTVLHSYLNCQSQCSQSTAEEQTAFARADIGTQTMYPGITVSSVECEVVGSRQSSLSDIWSSVNGSLNIIRRTKKQSGCESLGYHSGASDVSYSMMQDDHA